MTATRLHVIPPTIARVRRARTLGAAVGVLGAIALALPAGALAEPSFRGPTDYLTGSFARAVAVGDFNGDADPDLAVGNADAGNVSVLLGQARGTFGAATNFAVGGTPSSIAVADFDGDSHADLAVVNSVGVAVLLGDGSGSFTSAGNLLAGRLPFRAVAADLDGDSDPDLAVAGVDGVSVLLGEGDGSFGVATSFDAHDSPVGLAVGDFDSDSDLDLAVANQLSDDVSVLLGDGDGAFAAPVDYGAGDFAGSVATGDFDADSDLDVAVVNPSSHNVSVLLGEGDGTFGDATDYGVPGSLPVSVAMGNFDGDLDPDLAIAHRSGSVAVLRGEAGGSFATATNVVVGDQPLSLAAGDFNGDAELDLAVTKPLLGGIAVLLENDRPLAAAEAYVTDEDTPLEVAAPGVLGNDTDPELDELTPALVSGPDHGSVTLDGDGSFTYTPDRDYNGADSFSYRADDGNMDSDPVTVEIAVTPVDEPPPSAPASTPPADADSTPPTGATPAEPAISQLRLGSRCVRRARSGRVRIGMTLRMAHPGPVQVRIDRAVGSRDRSGCPQANATRRYETRFRRVAILRQVPTRPGAGGHRRLTLRLRLIPGLYRLTVRARSGDGRLSPPIRRYVRILGSRRSAAS